MVIDQGTTSTRVVLINKDGRISFKEQKKVKLIALDNGDIRQDANEILESVIFLINNIIKNNNINPKNIKAIGITNQRETTVIFDKLGKPLEYAISWQSKGTKNITDNWIKKGYEKIVKEKTGLPITPYFSASKIKKLTKDIKEKDYLIGTIDTFLLYNLSCEKSFFTDITNASRTMLFNINNQVWDDELLKLFEINKKHLPKVLPNDSLFGHYKFDNTLIPITTLIGDQQAALFGNRCFNKGDLKVTYGTGAFLLVNTGNKPISPNNNLITTIAYKINNKTYYACEGSVFCAGAAIEWLRDINVLSDVKKIDEMANSSNDETLIFVPTFVGLSAPRWNEDVKGAILGIKRSTTKCDIIKATLNGISYEINDIITSLNKSNIKITSLRADGGVSVNKYLMQRQADISNLTVYSSKEHEITALGAGYLAGLSSSFWKNIKEIKKFSRKDEIFKPKISNKKREELRKKWETAINATILFSK